MKKSFSSLSILFLSSGLLCATENLEYIPENFIAHESLLEELPPELTEHIFSFLENQSDIEKVGMASQCMRKIRNHYKLTEKQIQRTSIKLLQFEVSKIFCHEDVKRSIQVTKEAFQNIISKHPFHYIPNALEYLHNPTMLKKMYTPKLIFQQFGGKDEPLNVILERFKAHLLRGVSFLMFDLTVYLSSKDIKGLEICNYQISYLSPEVKNLTQLQKLRLYNNNIQTLPKELGRLTSLTTLNFFHNLELTLTINDLKNLLNLPKLQCINLNKTKAPKSIRKNFRSPEEINEFKKLALEEIRKEEPNYEPDSFSDKNGLKLSSMANND